MFARVRASTTQNMLVLTVLKPSCTDDEFEECMELTRAAYLAMPAGFVMVFDLCEMSLLSPRRYKQWLALFNSVRDVTERNLICTCVTYENALLQVAINVFLRLYDPVKPFHVFCSREECLAHARRCAPRLSEEAVPLARDGEGAPEQPGV